MVFLPPKVFNSYVYIDENTGNATECPPKECSRGFWSPGDFLVHFAGHKEHIEPFLRSFPPETWIGYQTHVAVPLERSAGTL